MQVFEVSFQYYHICKYLPGSSFQALNVFTKQEALTNKDQPPSFGLICLKPRPPLQCQGQPGLTWHVNSMSWFLENTKSKDLLTQSCLRTVRVQAHIHH